MNWGLSFLLLIFFETLADIFAKLMERTGNFHWAVAAQISFFVGNGFWLLALLNGVGMVRGGVLFSVTVAITAILVGLAGGEPVSGAEWLGVLFGLFSVGILSSMR